MAGVVKGDVVGRAGAAVDAVEEKAADDVVRVTHQVVEDRDAGSAGRNLDGHRNAEFESGVEGEEHLLHALFDGVEALVVGGRQQVGAGYPADGLNVLSDLGRHQQAPVAGLGALADLDQNSCRIFDHVGHGLDDAVPTEVAGSDLQDHIFEILALQQTHRHAALAGAHAYRQATFFVEIGDGHGDGFPHAPGKGADGHVADDYRVDPTYRGSLGVLNQLAVIGLLKGQPLGRQNTAQGCQAVEGMTRSIKAWVGHLRNSTNSNGVEGPGLNFQIVATTTLGAGSGSARVDDVEPGIGVARGADGVVRADSLTDTAAAAKVLNDIALGNDRLGGKTGFRFRSLAVGKDHAPSFHLGTDSVEGASRNARTAEGAAVLVVCDLPR